MNHSLWKIDDVKTIVNSNYLNFCSNCSFCSHIVRFLFVLKFSSIPRMFVYLVHKLISGLVTNNFRTPGKTPTGRCFSTSFILYKLCDQTPRVAFSLRWFQTSCLNGANTDKTKVEPSIIKAL